MQLKCTKQKICLIARNAGGEILPIADFMLSFVFVHGNSQCAHAHGQNSFASVCVSVSLSIWFVKMPAKNIALDSIFILFVRSFVTHAINFENLF